MRLFDYPDLYREVGSALLEQQHFNQALRYYEPLQQASGYVDASFLTELASCYRALDMKQKAIECYKAILNGDPANDQARFDLATMQGHKLPFLASTVGKGVSSVEQLKRRRSTRPRIETPNTAPVGDASVTSNMLAPCPTGQSTKRLTAEEPNLYPRFVRWQRQVEDMMESDEVAKDIWMEDTKLLLRAFQCNKVFYPYDKHHKFFGYSKQARSLASRPKHELDALIARTASVIGERDTSLINGSGGC